MKARRLPSLPAANQGPHESVLDKFVDHGLNVDTDRLTLRVRGFRYGAKHDAWEFVEVHPARKDPVYCARNDLDPDCPPLTLGRFRWPCRESASN